MDLGIPGAIVSVMFGVITTLISVYLRYRQWFILRFGNYLIGFARIVILALAVVYCAYSLLLFYSFVPGNEPLHYFLGDVSMAFSIIYLLLFFVIITYISIQMVTTRGKIIPILDMLSYGSKWEKFFAFVHGVFILFLIVLILICVINSASISEAVFTAISVVIATLVFIYPSQEKFLVKVTIGKKTFYGELLDIKDGIATFSVNRKILFIPLSRVTKMELLLNKRDNKEEAEKS